MSTCFEKNLSHSSPHMLKITKPNYLTILLYHPVLYVVHQRWQADPAGGDGKRTLHCMPVACLLATRTTWNELKSWQEKFLITTWLADWHACSSSSTAANGGQQVCVPSTSDLVWWRWYCSNARRLRQWWQESPPNEFPISCISELTLASLLLTLVAG